jgi:hypothetical protein
MEGSCVYICFRCYRAHFLEACILHSVVDSLYITVLSLLFELLFGLVVDSVESDVTVRHHSGGRLPESDEGQHVYASVPMPRNNIGLNSSLAEINLRGRLKRNRPTYLPFHCLYSMHQPHSVTHVMPLLSLSGRLGQTWVAMVSRLHMPLV